MSSRYAYGPDARSRSSQAIEDEAHREVEEDLLAEAEAAIEGEEHREAEVSIYILLLQLKLNLCFLLFT